MNSPNLGKLLILNRGVSGAEAWTPRTTDRKRPPPRHLVSVKPVQLTPVVPALEAGSRTRKRGPVGRIAVAIGCGTVVFGLLIAAGVFLFGLERIHHVRQNYQLSVQLKQRERELHQAQKACQTLAAFLAMRQAREMEAVEVQRVSFPAAIVKPALKRARARPSPVRGEQPCLKLASTDA